MRREKQGGAGFSPREEALGEGIGGGDEATEEIEAATEEIEVATELRAVADLRCGDA
jgi:hypothetical protein